MSRTIQAAGVITHGVSVACSTRGAYPSGALGVIYLVKFCHIVILIWAGIYVFDCHIDDIDTYNHKIPTLQCLIKKKISKGSAFFIQRVDEKSKKVILYVLKLHKINYRKDIIM